MSDVSLFFFSSLIQIGTTHFAISAKNNIDLVGFETSAGKFQIELLAELFTLKKSRVGFVYIAACHICPDATKITELNFKPVKL